MTQAPATLVEPDLVSALAPRVFGAVIAVDGPKIRIGGLGGLVRLGDRLSIVRRSGDPLTAEVLGVDRDGALAYAFGSTDGVTAGDRADLVSASPSVRPGASWLGRIINWRGETVDGAALEPGERVLRLDASPPPAALRRPIGARIATGLAAFDTFLPICEGQRIGIFAGSGVGKTSLLGDLAAGVQADIGVVALIGERSREVRAFAEAMASTGVLDRTVIVASTSDESALARRESARLALTVAEYFKRDGKHVLLILDSLTRFAEAHREIALARGEPPSLHAYPPSTVGALAALVERAGPGVHGEGAVTAIFSVLVAGSDMEEPVADMVRGLLDGHVVLDRAIAERGRYPAINVRRSVSRSLPAAASEEEGALLLEARALFTAYENAELVVRAGLYHSGSDPLTDRAIKIWPQLDAFVARSGMSDPQESFTFLRNILRSG